MDTSCDRDPGHRRAVVLAIAAYVFRKRQAQQIEERREEAQGTREEARAAERRAEQARLQAEEQAERAQREQAAAEELQRKADEVDPDVDRRRDRGCDEGREGPRAPLVPQPHAVLAVALQLDELERPQRERAVRQRRTAADQRRRHGQHQLVEQVGREDLAGEVAAADEPRSLNPRASISRTSSARSPANGSTSSAPASGASDSACVTIHVGLSPYGHEPCRTMKSQVRAPMISESTPA